MRALAKISQTPWAIQTDALTKIAKIASRDNDELWAIAKAGGEKSNNKILEYRGDTAVINVSGPIFRYANMFTDISGATSSDGIAKAIGEAEQNESVNNIIFNFDTPGGEATEINTLAEMIHTTPKRTIAYVGAMAASAGYWLASAADEIVISSTGMVGSIGTVATIDLSGDDGDQLEIVSSQSPKKRLDAESDEGKAEIQAMVDKMAGVFIEDVANYRNVSTAHVLAKFGQGGLLMGAEAVNAGMADKLGSFETLITTIEGNSMSEEQKGIFFAEEDFNADFIKANHAELYNSIFKAGAEQERARILAVKENSIPGLEEQIESMMFDGETSGEQAAVAMLKAVKEQGAQVAAQIAQVQAPISDEPVDSRDENQKAWDNNAGGCRDTFSSFANYKSYQEGVKKGAIRIIG
jgi:ClpP class serine protease